VADYTIRVESDSNAAQRDLDNIDNRLKNLQAPIKINVQFPSLSETVKGVQDVGKALQTTYGIARNVVPALMDIESVGKALGDTFKTAAQAAILLSQASPGKTLAVSLQGAVIASDALVNSVARLGFTIFGLTQSVNVLKSAYGGMFDETIGREVRLQQVMLQTQTTIAATNKILRNGVELTNPLDSVLALKRPIQKAIDEIRVESLEIAGTTSEAIIQVFGTVSSQIGQVGGSIEDAKKLALSFSAALGTIGMSDPGLATQEVGSMLRGDIDNNSILARSLGITNKDIQKAKQAGDLVDFITKKLAAFTAGQKIQAQGFAGITSNIKEIQQELGRALGAPMLQPLLDGLGETYRRMSLIVKPAMEIADGMGRAGAAIGQGVIGAGMAAPSLQKFDDGAQKDLFNDINKATAELFITVQAQVENLRPVIAKFTDELVKAFVMVGTGLKNLFLGFADFKFEQLKILVNTLANMGAVLNATVIPAVSGLLTVYGQLIALPLFQYVSQVTAQFVVLEKIGVNGLIRIGMVVPSVLKSIMQFKAGFDTVVSAIGAGLTKVGTWISTAIAGASQGISFVIGKLVTFGTTLISSTLQWAAVLARAIATALVNIAVFVQEAYPQFTKLAIAISEVGRSFNAISLGAARAAGAVDIEATKMLLALEKLKVSANDVGNTARQGMNRLGESVKGAAGAIGGAVKGMVLSFASFMAWMVVAQVGTAMLIDLFGRMQRARDEIASQTKTELAIKRLSTVYKDLGDNASYAAQKGKEADEAQVNSRWDELTKKIQETNKALNDLNYDISTEGLNSWAELGLAILSSFTPDLDRNTLQQEQMKKLLEDNQKSKDELTRIGNLKDRVQQEEDLRILGQKKIDISKEIRAQERAHENVMFQLRQQSLQKASEIISLESDLRIKAADRLNAKLLEGQEGVARSVTQGINEYLSIKAKGEQSIENNRRALQIEINSMEKSIMDYRFEAEKTIAQMRMKVGDYEKKVSEYKVQQAALEEKARRSEGNPSNPITAPGVGSGFLVGSTGNSTGPHLDLRGPDKQKVIEEALAIVKALQRSGVAYMELPNLAKLEPQNKNILNVTDEKELRRRLSVEQGAHDSTRGRRPGQSKNAVDISLPAGTLIPVPVSKAEWTNGGGGYTATSLLTGNQMLHGLKTSMASGTTMGPSTVQGRPVGTKSTLGGKSVTWNGQAWVGEDGQAKKGTPPSALAAPQVPDLSALFSGQTGAQASMTRNLEAQLQRIDDLSSKIISANTAEAFDNIIANALPKVGLEEARTALANANTELMSVRANLGKVYDPQEFELAVANQQKMNGLIRIYDAALEKIKQNKPDGTPLVPMDKQEALIKRLDEWRRQEVASLDRSKPANEERRVELERQTLKTKQETAQIQRIQNELLEVQLNLERQKIAIGVRVASMSLRPDDFVGNRLIQADADIANKKLDIKKERPLITDEELNRVVGQYAIAVKDAAVALGTLEVNAKKQSDTWARASEMGRELTGGFRNMLKTISTGGDVTVAVGEMLSSIGNKFMDMSFDLVAKPLETSITQFIAQLLGVQTTAALQASASASNTGALTAAGTITAANTTVVGLQTAATTANTAALVALTGAIAASAGASAASGGSSIAKIAFSLASSLISGGVGAIGGGGASFSSAFSSAPSTSFGQALQMPNLLGSARNGGVFTPEGMAKLPSFSSGGIARGSSSGYLAELHGTEAVIPMPNGKALPVELRGDSASQALQGSLSAMEQNYQSGGSQEALLGSLRAMEENYQTTTLMAASQPLTIQYERVGTGDLPFVTEEQFRQGIEDSGKAIRRDAKREADQQWRSSLRNDTRVPGVR